MLLVVVHEVVDVGPHEIQQSVTVGLLQLEREISFRLGGEF